MAPTYGVVESWKSGSPLQFPLSPLHADRNDEPAHSDKEFFGVARGEKSLLAFAVRTRGKVNREKLLQIQAPELPPRAGQVSGDKGVGGVLPYQRFLDFQSGVQTTGGAGPVPGFHQNPRQALIVLGERE